MKYTELITETGSKVIVRDNEDGSVSYIPIDEANSDYQSYLEYLAEKVTAPTE